MSAVIRVKCDCCPRTAEFDPWIFPTNAREAHWMVNFDPQQRLAARCSDCAPFATPPIEAKDLKELPPPSESGQARARALFDLINTYKLGD